jgi:hypothetical protein
MTNQKNNSAAFILAAGVVLTIGAMAYAGGHTWRFNEIFSNAAGNIQYIEFRESLGGAGEVAVNGHTINTLTPPVHSYVIPPPSVVPPTGFKTFLIATPDCAALPGFPAPDRILPAASVPFFSVVNDTISVPGWPPNMVYAAGQLPTDGVHSRNVIGPVIACNTPTNYAGATITLNLGCSVMGDVDGSGILDGNDVAAYVRVILNTPILGDNAACAEYCLGTVEANTDAFVNALVSAP